ncbi:MAG: type II secretion system F family protein [Telluria sp.]
MDYTFLTFIILIFVAVVLGLEGAYAAWNGSRGPAAARISRRLRAIEHQSGEHKASMIRERALSNSAALQGLLERVRWSGRLDVLLLQSGLSWNVGYLLMLMAACAVAALAFGQYAALPWPFTAGLTALLSCLPIGYVRHARRKRLQKFESQLPDALDMMGRALRAGHAFPTALKMVGEEMPEPVAEEFRTVFDEVNFGIAMQDALTSLAARVPVTDLRFFVIAVMIQRETGGNLAELLNNITIIMRDRVKLFAKVRVLSAEGKMSAWVLCLLPFAAGLMIQITNPAFLAVLYTDPVGRLLMYGALTLMVAGIFAMRRIIDIKV